MEKSLSKDIRKLYTKSIMWTVMMTFLTIIAFSTLIAYMMREITPANHAENTAIEASLEMRENTPRYMDENEFLEKQNTLQNNGVYLSEYSMDGTMISGPERLSSLFQGKSIPELINTTISSNGYYHKIFPISTDEEIEGIWVYSYQLKAMFSSEYYRYIILGLVFLMLLSPIIYFIIFSRYYINKLYQTIKTPLEELMTASHKISEKDLDFYLNYDSNNEIGQLTRSFRQMQGELKKSLYENWKKDSDWAVMMSSLSHDLKTPITLIGLSSETLANDKSMSEEQKMNVEIITRNIAKANSLLENMNVAGSIKNPTAVKEETTLFNLINEIEADFKPLMEDKSVNYSYQSTVDMNITVPHLKMNRILHNIFSNAVQYTPNGGEIIFTINQSDNHLLLALENSGEGIKKENWEKVFKKHYREDQSRPNLHGNSGLGLYITKQLIESINGTIVITHPKTLGGIRFEIMLPFKG
ncbi:HAMP domain-containing histidine kinase [Virgibacillus sp. NKC19-3]|uniref:HAMP domain-containing sensor histidine kinase n=1 Tax=Virgibacillus saliphilus TaxID=2831674 RepID=UPI001C9BBA3E|nr:HAMP domain-containing sensor histidine kinase [Virgibacillus sp. NKC19-3]MBY7141830.1 HAMP domain-containing histidine kinase [Virgibacillus sp. NKC19-3]